MYVSLVIYGSLDTVSGGYLYDRQLVDYLRRCGDQIEIVSLPWQNYGRHLAHNFSRHLYQRLRRSRFDLLLQDELNHPSLFWLNWNLRRRVRYPIVSIVHHLRSNEKRPAWQNRFYRWVERRYLTSVDGFVFNSQTTRAVVETLTDQRRPYVVAYPAGDHLRPALSAEAIRSRAEEDGALRLIFVGNVIPRKGLHVLLAALARLAGKAWQLAIVGNTNVDPGYTQAIKHTIQAYRLGGQVHWHGSVAGADLSRQMAQSHLLVVPSSYEGFGIVYLEGMGFGLPAVATTAGAAYEIISHGRHGYLISPEDDDVLAQHLQTLVEDRQRLLRMSLAARQRYLAHPTWPETMARIRQFLQAIT